MKKARKIWLSMIIVEATSIPLLFLTIIMIVTGFTLVYPEAMSDLMFGVIDYSKAYKLHTDPVIRTCFTLLAILHSLAGTHILLEKYVRKTLIKALIEIVILSILAYIALAIILIELIA